MASREYLKHLKSAKLGDSHAQYCLAQGYLTGAYRTPINHSIGLIWLEKAYNSIEKYQSRNHKLPLPSELIISVSNFHIFELATHIKIHAIVESPSFSFAWHVFWKLANFHSKGLNHAFSASTVQSLIDRARWQLVLFVLDPNFVKAQERLFLFNQTHSPYKNPLGNEDILLVTKRCERFLSVLSSSENEYYKFAKDFSYQLKNSNNLPADLWEKWLINKDQNCLIRAAEMGHEPAQFTLGVWLSKLEIISDSGKVNSNLAIINKKASYKKAIYWLKLSSKKGNREAYFALGKIYRQPQFSGYNRSSSDKYFEYAAKLGHPDALYFRALSLWRKRKDSREEVKGLSALAYLLRSHESGHSHAKIILEKILKSYATNKANPWGALSKLTSKALSSKNVSHINMLDLLMIYRIRLAYLFNLSKSELLFADIAEFKNEFFIVINVKHTLPKIQPRIIQIQSKEQQTVLIDINNILKDKTMMLANLYEGSIHQKRYRFTKVLLWLKSTYGVKE
jgi:TPR repeat protein